MTGINLECVVWTLKLSLCPLQVSIYFFIFSLELIIPVVCSILSVHNKCKLKAL